MHRSPHVRHALMIAAMGVLLLVAACTDEAVDTAMEKPDDEEPAEAVVAEEPPEEEPPAGDGHVQDLWIYERVSTLRPGQELTDISAEVVDALATDIAREVALTDGATFLVSEALDVRIDDLDGVHRDDLDVVAGIVEHDGAQAVAILATPDPAAEAGIGFSDEIILDLTSLGEDVVAPGATLVIDHAFLQGQPAEDGDGRAAEADLEGPELLALRMSEERVAYLGAEVDGEVVVQYYTGHLGVTVAGTTTGKVPTKANPMIESMADGLDGCEFGLQCVADFFDSFGDGAKESWDLAWDNGFPDRDPPPPPPSEPCYSPNCGRSKGEPHIRTFDGRRSQMHAVGEFVLAQNEGMEVQLRTIGWSRPNVSSGGAVAFTLGGASVAFDRDAPSGERLHVDGELTTLQALREEPLRVGELELSVTGDSLQALADDGRMVTVVIWDARGLIDVYVDLGPETEGSQGLLGSANGSVSDDFTSRDGQLIEGAHTDPDFYPVFVDSWRITDDTSLFVYPEGLGTEDFTDRSVPSLAIEVDDLDEDVLRWAAEVCELAGVVDEEAVETCVFDVAVTEEPGLASSSRTSQVIDRILDGRLIPERAILRGLIDLEQFAALVGDGADDGISSELATGNLSAEPGRLLWTFEDGTFEPTSVPDSVEASAILDPNELPTVQVTDRYDYPNSPVLRFSPFNLSETPEEAVANDAYLEFTVTPVDGPVSVDRLFVSMARGAAIGDERGLQVRSSLDDFAEPIWFDEVLTVRPEIERFSVPLEGLRLTGETTFRLYANTPGRARTMEIGDLAFDLSS